MLGWVCRRSSAGDGSQKFWHGCGGITWLRFGQCRPSQSLSQDFQGFGLKKRRAPAAFHHRWHHEKSTGALSALLPTIPSHYFLAPKIGILCVCFSVGRGLPSGPITSDMLHRRYFCHGATATRSKCRIPTPKAKANDRGRLSTSRVNSRRCLFLSQFIFSHRVASWPASDSYINLTCPFSTKLQSQTNQSIPLAASHQSSWLPTTTQDDSRQRKNKGTPALHVNQPRHPISSPPTGPVFLDGSSVSHMKPSSSSPF